MPIEFSADSIDDQLDRASKGFSRPRCKDLDAGGSADDKIEFSIPILESPSLLFQLLLGRDVDLLILDLPKLNFRFDYAQSFPIFPPLNAQLSGYIEAGADLAFGYDTFGLRRMLDTEDVSDLLDGFYVRDRVDGKPDGAEIREFYLTGGIQAGAVLDVLVAEAGVKGGISATIAADLNDPNDDGKMRFGEFVQYIDERRPACIFDLHGELAANIEAFIWILWVIDESWKEEWTILSFDIGCDPTVTDVELAHLVGNKLILNMGPQAANRGDTSDGGHMRWHLSKRRQSRGRSLLDYTRPQHS